MLDLKDRLLVVEDEFHSALSEGEAAVHAFNKRWETLLEDINSALDSPFGLNPETSVLAHATAVRLAELADISFHLFSNYNNITTQLVGELDCLMSELTITDSEPCPTSSLPPALDVGSCFTNITRRKRRRSEDEQSHESMSCKSGKRQRHCSVAHGSLPPETVCRRPSSAEPTSFSSQSTSTVASANHKRKRRLSDTDARPLKPSKLLYTGPRLHAASDSFPALRALPSDSPVNEADGPSLWDLQALDAVDSTSLDLQPGLPSQFDVCPTLSSLGEHSFSPLLILNTPLLALPNSSPVLPTNQPDPLATDSSDVCTLRSLEPGSDTTISLDTINFGSAPSCVDDSLQNTWSMLASMFDSDYFPSLFEGYPSMQPFHPISTPHIVDGNSDIHWASLLQSQPVSETSSSLRSDSCGSDSSSDSEDECPTPRSQVDYQPFLFQCKENSPAVFATLEDVESLHSK